MFVGEAPCPGGSLRRGAIGVEFDNRLLDSLQTGLNHALQEGGQ